MILDFEGYNRNDELWVRGDGVRRGDGMARDLLLESRTPVSVCIVLPTTKFRVRLAWLIVNG